MSKFEDLKGKVLTSVEQTTRYDNDAIVFTCDDGTKYLLTHYQDCCEHVYLESVEGELSDLVGSPIFVAEEVVGEIIKDEGGDEQYTFYKLATVKGYVTLRWNGKSNGYYSISVRFGEVEA